MPDIYIGQKSLYVGTSPVKAVYVGANLVWPEPTELPYYTTTVYINTSTISSFQQGEYCLQVRFSDPSAGYFYPDGVPNCYVDGKACIQDGGDRYINLKQNDAYITIKAPEGVSVIFNYGKTNNRYTDASATLQGSTDNYNWANIYNIIPFDSYYTKYRITAIPQ